jgi:hypothetical protein
MKNSCNFRPNGLGKKKKPTRNNECSIVDGWINKGGATPDRSRTPARGPLFGPNVLVQCSIVS